MSRNKKFGIAGAILCLFLFLCLVRWLYERHLVLVAYEMLNELSFTAQVGSVKADLLRGTVVVRKLIIEEPGVAVSFDSLDIKGIALLGWLKNEPVVLAEKMILMGAEWSFTEDNGTFFCSAENITVQNIKANPGLFNRNLDLLPSLAGAVIGKITVKDIQSFYSPRTSVALKLAENKRMPENTLEQRANHLLATVRNGAKLDVSSLEVESLSTYSFNSIVFHDILLKNDNNNLLSVKGLSCEEGFFPGLGTAMFLAVSRIKELRISNFLLEDEKEKPIFLEQALFSTDVSLLGGRAQLFVENLTTPVSLYRMYPWANELANTVQNGMIDISLAIKITSGMYLPGKGLFWQAALSYLRVGDQIAVKGKGKGFLFSKKECPLSLEGVQLSIDTTTVEPPSNAQHKLLAEIKSQLAVLVKQEEENLFLTETLRTLELCFQPKFPICLR